ncbi:BQ5605_C012g06955 [Microbotryum silenes-dioicae]|uniref:BQ5605_C012g06955 protein n=1 Tax=Microbotryum silenes-dioicae TaxID=796604 RepID=A0A2X0LSE5_9BASI|nr:BQ5605_C012g06955 [Microbotryum silenes-dioicae]
MSLPGGAFTAKPFARAHPLAVQPFFHHLVKTLQTSFTILTSSLEVYRIDQGTREEVAKALLPSKHKLQPAPRASHCEY